MNFAVVSALPEQLPVIEHLMQLYQYDFSEFTDSDVLSDGRFPSYPDLSSYWTTPGKKFPYLVQAGAYYAGFALVGLREGEGQTCFFIAEFFVLKKYRRKGIGRRAAHFLFDAHRGYWEVFQKTRNLPARHFWIAAIDAYTEGKFTSREGDGRTTQSFES